MVSGNACTERVGVLVVSHRLTDSVQLTHNLSVLQSLAITAETEAVSATEECKPNKIHEGIVHPSVVLPAYGSHVGK